MPTPTSTPATTAGPRSSYIPDMNAEQDMTEATGSDVIESWPEEFKEDAQLVDGRASHRCAFA